MMGPQSLDRLDLKTAAILASLAQRLPARVVSPDWHKSYDAYSVDELARGVLQVVSLGEGDYLSGPGTVAREGVQRLAVIGYLKLDDTEHPSALQTAEFTLIEEIKAWARAGVTGIGLRLESVDQSRQLEHPYGWVVAIIQAGPPDSTTN